MKLFGAGKPDHPMAERKDATRLLGELPAQDLKALEELAHWHESVGAAEGFKPEERVHRLTAIDEAAQPRLRKLSRDYLTSARTGGSRAQENLIWARVHEYWRQAGQAFARAIDEKKPQPPVVLAALRALAQQLKWQQLKYGPVDLAVWGLMNRLFALAESRGIAEAQPELLKAAMFSAASPESLLVPDAELAERVIAELAPGFVLAKAAAPELPYWIDLGRGMAPARCTQAPQQPAPGLRFMGAGAALGRLTAMIQATEAKRVVPPELKLGAEVDAESVLTVMRHLASYWAPAARERKHKRHSMKSSLKIAHGFNGVLEALGGMSEDSLDFGGKPAGESWQIENVSAGGFGALVMVAKSEWLKVGALVAAQPDGAPWQVGTVRRMTKVSGQEVRVGVETLSRSPALSEFALGTGQAQGVLLPAAAPGDAAIALRAGVYARGENLEASIGGRQHVYMPQGVAVRGDDYEIFRFKEMVRES